MNRRRVDLGAWGGGEVALDSLALGWIGATEWRTLRLLVVLRDVVRGPSPRPRAGHGNAIGIVGLGRETHSRAAETGRDDDLVPAVPRRHGWSTRGLNVLSLAIRLGVSGDCGVLGPGEGRRRLSKRGIRGPTTVGGTRHVAATALARMILLSAEIIRRSYLGSRLRGNNRLGRRWMGRHSVELLLRSGESNLGLALVRLRGQCVFVGSKPTTYGGRHRGWSRRSRFTARITSHAGPRRRLFR